MSNLLTAPTKTTLDQRGRALRELRVSLTDRCNLRCTYCMPEELFGPDFRFMAHERLLTFDEIEAIVRGFADFGVHKVRLTGGEPLLRKDLAGLITRLAQIPGVQDFALTTNGLLLPKLAPKLADAGLQRVNISLDALSAEGLRRISGRSLSPNKIIAGIDAARSAGLGIKINAVIQKGKNDDEILPLARMFHDLVIPLRFIEFMDVGNSNSWAVDSVVTGKTIRRLLAKSLAPLQRKEEANFAEVARNYIYVDNGAEVGFIESISQPFCGGCTRARVTASGELLTCLFAARGIDLMPALRPKIDSKQLLQLINQRWKTRDDRYSELRRAIKKSPKTEMWQVGG